MDRTATEQAIARDLELCDLGLALTKGAARRRFKEQRKVCMDAIKVMNKAGGLDTLSDDELLAALAEGFA